MVLIKKSLKMSPKRFFLIALAILLSCFGITGQEYRVMKDSEGLTGIRSGSGIENPITIRVIYDNYPKVKGLKTGWGFSVAIEGLEKYVIFDTGADQKIFEHNFRNMGLNVKGTDIVVLSHEHSDHTEGLPFIARDSKGIPVLFPYSFSDQFKMEVRASGLEPLLIKDPVRICSDLYSSGEFSGPVPEQCLVLDTKNGLVVMTGCAHPGIIEMLKEIKAKFGKNIFLVFGGFHLLEKPEKEMQEIIQEMKSLGVVKCGATHCTGKKQIEMIRDAYGIYFVELGVGNTIVIN